MPVVHLKHEFKLQVIQLFFDYDFKNVLYVYLIVSSIVFQMADEQKEPTNVHGRKCFIKNVCNSFIFLG